MSLTRKVDMLRVVVGEISEGSTGKSSLSKDDVIDILADQFGNEDASREQLKYWVVSNNFRLMDVYVSLNSLGVNHWKKGETRSGNKPIIVDQNVHEVAKPFGRYGEAPLFMVIDGQNRVVAARKKGMRTKLKAYVGDRIYGKMQDAMRDAERIFSDVDATIDEFMKKDLPGITFGKLKGFVERGLMSKEELDDIRNEWRKKRGLEPK